MTQPIRYRRVTCLTPWGELRKAEEDELLLTMITNLNGENAWGFGAHPTSSLSLSILLGLYQEGAPNPQRVLDVGCGAGVLSIAAAKLGAREIRGIDINEAAPDIAYSNAANNGIESYKFDSTPVGQIEGNFDLVLANLPSQQIQLELHRELAARASGGLLICSGFKIAELAEITAAYAEANLRLLYSAEEVTLAGVEWCAALFKSKLRRP